MALPEEDRQAIVGAFSKISEVVDPVLSTSPIARDMLAEIVASLRLVPPSYLSVQQCQGTRELVPPEEDRSAF
jgi:hypothetical protein